MPTPEQWEARLWTRLQNVADEEDTTFEEMALKPDRELLRWPNMGFKCLALFRTRYARNPIEPPPKGPERDKMIETLESAVTALTAALAALRGGA